MLYIFKILFLILLYKFKTIIYYKRILNVLADLHLIQLIYYLWNSFLFWKSYFIQRKIYKVSNNKVQRMYYNFLQSIEKFKFQEKFLSQINILKRKNGKQAKVDMTQRYIFNLSEIRIIHSSGRVYFFYAWCFVKY